MRSLNDDSRKHPSKAYFDNEIDKRSHALASHHASIHAKRGTGVHISIETAGIAKLNREMRDLRKRRNKLYKT